MESKLVSSCDYLSKSKKDVYLFEKLWKENTTLLLHGTREADKTSAAVNIALSVAGKGREVVYVDTQHRLHNHADKLVSAQNMFILEPGYDDPSDPRDYADLVISSIEEIITTTELRTFIVDSVTRIAALSFGRNASAAYIMKRLVALQIRYGLSLIVIAHDATKATDRAIANLADNKKEITVDQPTETVSETPKDQPAPSKSTSVQQRPRLCFDNPTLTPGQRRMVEEKAPHSGLI